MITIVFVCPIQSKSSTKIVDLSWESMKVTHKKDFQFFVWLINRYKQTNLLSRSKIFRFILAKDPMINFVNGESHISNHTK